MVRSVIKKVSTENDELIAVETDFEDKSVFISVNDAETIYLNEDDVSTLISVLTEAKNSVYKK